MSPRNKRLEQERPGKDSAVKRWERKDKSSHTFPKKGKGSFTAKDLPKGKIAQHRAKPGMTTPQ